MTETKTTWHPYPATKPAEDGKYLLTVEDDFGHRMIVIITYARGAFWGECAAAERLITAWAELPEPYKKEKDE